MTGKEQYDFFDKRVKRTLSPKRYFHSKCVAEESYRLAVIFGADREKAKLAGLLHDITKELPREVQLQRLETNDILLSMELLDNPSVWHGITASIFLQEEWKITDPEILSAVRYHTTGRAKMSGIELAVFVADYTSVDRNYLDIEVVRQLLLGNPLAAVVEGFSFGIQAALRNKTMLLPDSVEGYNYYKKQLLEETGEGEHT